MNDSNTIGEAKKFLRDNWENGCECPTCKQHVQLYKHSINGTMIKSLIELYKLDEANPNGRGEYFHISQFELWRNGYGGGQFAKVKYWGLAVNARNDDEAKRTSGMWAITPKGRDFVKGLISIPRKVRIFNGESYGHIGDAVTVTDVLGTKFNYKELMGDYMQINNQGSLL